LAVRTSNLRAWYALRLPLLTKFLDWVKLEHAGSPRLKEDKRSSTIPNLFVEDQTQIAHRIPTSARKSAQRPASYQSQSEGTVPRTWQSLLFNIRQARRSSDWEDAEPFLVYDIRKWTAVLLASTVIFICDIGRFIIHGWLLSPILAVIWFLKFYSEHTLYVEASGESPTLREYVFPHILGYLIVSGADKMGWLKGWFIFAIVLLMIRFLPRHRFAFYTERIFIQLLFPGLYTMWAVFQYLISLPIIYIPTMTAVLLVPSLRRREWVPDRYSFVLENRGEHVLNV
jgi:hypothetical protein